MKIIVATLFLSVCAAGNARAENLPAPTSQEAMRAKKRAQAAVRNQIGNIWPSCTGIKNALIPHYDLHLNKAYYVHCREGFPVIE